MAMALLPPHPAQHAGSGAAARCVGESKWSFSEHCKPLLHDRLSETDHFQALSSVERAQRVPSLREDIC